MVRFVIENGAWTFHSDFSLLSLASWRGSSDIVRYLLDYEIKPYGGDIVHAIYAGNEQIAKELINAGGALPSDDEEFELAPWGRLPFPEYYFPEFVTIEDAVAQSGIDLSSLLHGGSLNAVAEVKKIFATSALPDESPKYKYGPEQMFDGNPNTAWNEGTDGNGENELFSISFDEPVRIDRIEFMAGYFDERWFLANCRVKKLEIELFKGDSIVVYLNTIDFADMMTAHTLQLGRNIEITRASFRVLEVYPGDQWSDLAFAETQFFLGENRGICAVRIFLLSNKLARNRKIFYPINRAKSRS